MILCWRRHGKAGGCRIPLKTIRWMRFEIERTHRNGWTICDEDVLTYTSREVLFHITGFYQWFISSSLSRLWMTDKWSVKWLYIAVRKQSFLTHVQARYENKTLRRLMKASFQRIRNILFSQCTLKTAYWINQDKIFLKDNIKTSEVLHESVTKQTKNKQLLIVNTISQRCNAMHLRGTPYPRCESIG